jgi:iron complex transport system substrate-binding protein
VLVLGGDLAEIAFALGAGGRVVATDDTALHPPEAAALPKVGYLRRLSAEGILAVGAELVLASPDAGPPAVVEQLRGAGVALEVAPEGDGFASVAPKVAFVGRALGLEAEAAALNARIEAEMAAVEAGLAGLADWPSVLFLISVANGAPTARRSRSSAGAPARSASPRTWAGFSGPPPPASVGPRAVGQELT